MTRGVLLAGMGVLALALGVRVAGLGSFSLWLDEILQMLQTQGTLAETWRALRSDRVHPPLEGLLSWALQGLGLSETARRLVPVAFGVATVALLAQWARGAFGLRAALFAGLIAALSPFHIHYSQEIRPYSMALFFSVVALWSCHRLVREWSRGWAVVLFLSFLGAIYTLYWTLLLVLPLASSVLAAPSGRGDAAAGRAALLRASPWLAGGWLLAYTPWAPVVLGLAGSRYGGTEPWTLDRLARRWEFLTVGGREGDPLSAGGLLALALLAVGVWAALRSWSGRTVLAGLVAGSVVVELVLLATDHWTNARYSVLAWPFLVVLLALGADTLWRLRRAWWVAPVALAGLLVFQMAGIVRYDAAGRPSWDRLAEALGHMRLPGEPILTENDWTHISLGYYLQGPDFLYRAGEEIAPRSARGSLARLRELWPEDACALLVVAGYPQSVEIRRQVEELPLLLHYRDATDARVYLLPPLGGSGSTAAAAAPLCVDVMRLPPAPLRRPSQGPLAGRVLASGEGYPSRLRRPSLSVLGLR